MPRALLRVIIIGGGLGGLCLAQGLKQAGIAFTVFERDADAGARAQGYRLSMTPDGFAAIRKNLPDPLWQRVAGAIAPLGGMALATEQLDELMFIKVPAAETAVRRYGSISRVTLRDILLAELGDHVQFAKQFARYEIAADQSVRCVFEDGTAAHGDLLVGCDGASSRVGAQVLPAAARSDTGVCAIAGKIPLDDATRADYLAPPLGDSAVIIDRKPGGMFLAKHELDGGQGAYIYWSIGGSRQRFPDGLDAMPAAALLQLVAQMTAGWHPRLLRLLQRADPATVRVLRFRVSTQVKPWPSGPVTLLGDAIHSMPPSGGLGANTAVIDASVLAEELAGYAGGRGSLVDAVHHYEAKMRKYAYPAIDESMQNLRRMARENPFARRAGRVGAKLAGKLLGMTRR